MTGQRAVVGRSPALTQHDHIDGTVTLYGVTSTVGGLTGPGANPNKLVTITDNPAAATQPSGETFTTLRTATAGDVYRGVSLTPGS